MRTGYKYEPRCKICTAKDYKGNPIRDDIDAYASTGATLKEVQGKLAEHGIFVSIPNISNHFRKHSPFVRVAKKLGTQRSRKLQLRIKREFRESSEALQRIIDIGDRMVENWEKENFEGIENDAPKMPVTERLYIEALKEQGRRGTRTVLDAEFELMDKALFETVQGNGKISNTKTIQRKLGSGKR